MSRVQKSQWVYLDKPEEPFESAEQAWFWFVRTTKLRHDGARFDFAAADVSRPCLPADVYRSVMALRHLGRLKRIHMVVLNRFGNLERPPDARDRREEMAARHWDQAMDRLQTVLVAKKIVQLPPSQPHSKAAYPESCAPT